MLAATVVRRVLANFTVLYCWLIREIIIILSCCKQLNVMKTALVNKAKSETKQCSLNCVGYLPNLQTHNINLDDDRCIFFKRLKLKPNKQEISDKKTNNKY